MTPVPRRPPRVLQVYRERLKPGCEAAYRAIEEETARLAATLGCPHPYLGAETLSEPREVWWFNGYESVAQQKQVAGEYAKNTRLLAALQENSKRKAALTFEPIEVLATYRGASRGEAPWVLGDGRYLVIAVTKINRGVTGAVFAATDGTIYAVMSARTREAADAARAGISAESFVLAVRPAFSFPAREWIESDAPFWQRDPLSNR